MKSYSIKKMGNVTVSKEEEEATLALALSS